MRNEIRKPGIRRLRQSTVVQPARHLTQLVDCCADNTEKGPVRSQLTHWQASCIARVWAWARSLLQISRSKCLPRLLVPSNQHRFSKSEPVRVATQNTGFTGTSCQSITAIGCSAPSAANLLSPGAARSSAPWPTAHYHRTSGSNIRRRS